MVSRRSHPVERSRSMAKSVGARTESCSLSTPSLYVTRPSRRCGSLPCALWPGAKGAYRLMGAEFLEELRPFPLAQLLEVLPVHRLRRLMLLLHT